MSDTEPAPLRVAVVGMGVGQEHVYGYTRRRDLFAITVLCDTDASRAEPLAARLRGVRVVTDLAEVAAADDVDVVSLCTPPFLHAEQVAVLLEAGKHVVCEKPLVGSLADVDRLAQLEEASAGRLMPVFQYRYGTGLEKLRHLVRAGLTGPAFLTTMELAWRRGPDYYAVPWRGHPDTELGGILLSHCVHGLDMVTHVLGPAQVASARVATRVNDIETEDCAVASVELADGSLLSLAATLGAATELSRHRFVFRHLTAESGTEPYTSSSDPWSFVAADAEHQGRVDAALAEWEAQPEGYQRQFELLHEALRTGGPLPVAVADARASIELVTALYWSARTGEAVTLPIDDDHPAYGGWR